MYPKTIVCGACIIFSLEVLSSKNSKLPQGGRVYLQYNTVVVSIGSLRKGFRFYAAFLEFPQEAVRDRNEIGI